MFRALIALLLLLIATSHASAQTLEDIDRREAAVMEAWEATPLTIRRAFFVSEHPQGFGEYIQRANNVFKSDEQLVAYAEPVGFGWKDIGNGEYRFGFKVDFEVKTAEGKVLGGQENFADLSQRSHTHNREFMVVLTLKVSDAPPGDYVVEYKLRDTTGPKTTSFSLPFKIIK